MTNRSSTLKTVRWKQRPTHRRVVKSVSGTAPGEWLKHRLRCHRTPFGVCGNSGICSGLCACGRKKNTCTGAKARRKKGLNSLKQPGEKPQKRDVAQFPTYKSEQHSICSTLCLFGFCSLACLGFEAGPATTRPGICQEPTHQTYPRPLPQPPRRPGGDPTHLVVERKKVFAPCCCEVGGV